MKVLGVIPARFNSTRFPGKPLVDINGKSMIQRVFEQASKSTLVDKVLVATDDQRIYQHVKSFNGEVILTSTNHKTGTDRCIEAFQKSLEDFGLMINIQGDEPFIDPDQIDQLIRFLENHDQFMIGTQAIALNDLSSISNPNHVKVVFNKDGSAMYFSRSPVPFVRENEGYSYFKHIGIYAFKKQIIDQIANLEPTKLEIAESLEQLRWLENGIEIGVQLTTLESKSIDTPDDLAAAITFYSDRE